MNPIVKLVKENSNPETTLQILRVLNAVKAEDLTTVIAEYKRYLNGEVKILTVISKIQLSSEQEKEIEEKMKAKVQTELLFSFEVDANQNNAIKFYLNDSELLP
jgi:F0F1-type ATP synthase delta subunit